MGLGWGVRGDELSEGVQGRTDGEQGYQGQAEAGEAAQTEG